MVKLLILLALLPRILLLAGTIIYIDMMEVARGVAKNLPETKD